MNSTTYGVMMIVLGLVIAVCSIGGATRILSERVASAITIACAVIIIVCGVLAIQFRLNT